MVRRRIATPPISVEGIGEVYRHVPREDVPSNEDLVGIDELAGYLESRGDSSYELIAVGDIMLGGRADEIIVAQGADRCFAGVGPLLRRSPRVLGNLEGPFAPAEWKTARRHSYAVPPERAIALSRANINTLTLANNHLMDCGRRGVVRTLDTLRDAGLTAIGGGKDETSARRPLVYDAGGMRIGICGYYWNKRCAAIGARPGGAMDTPETLQAELGELRRHVDRLIVTFHWGVPYEREPLPEDRAKARFAIDCGADFVIGHHAHVIQPMEIYKDRVIAYGIGNFAFGSGNSHAEGALLGLGLTTEHTVVDVFPLYVKNRDPRVNYQPRLTRGVAAKRILNKLAESSEGYGARMEMHSGWGRVRVPWRPRS